MALVLLLLSAHVDYVLCDAGLARQEDNLGCQTL
jgi:hypothetical protein